MELTVWSHDSSDSQVYVDPSILHASEGDVAELWVSYSEEEHGKSLDSPVDTNRSSNASGSRTSKKRKRRNLYFHICKPQAAKQAAISVSASILQVLGIQPRTQVHVQVLKAEQLKKTELDVVEIHFKGVYLTRNDHYRIAKSLNGRCVHNGQRLSYMNDSVRLTIETLFRGGRERFSGFLGPNSRVVFRSDSANILIFIHMTHEMWNFDETGDIMFHRLVNSFLPEMLHKWHAQGDMHLISLVLFTSVGSMDARTEKSGELVKNTMNFYRIVVDSASISRWSDIMSILRREFERFPKEVLEDPETHELRGIFLPSTKSNILEALSLATTLLTGKFVDRDLCRSGVQAMIVTAGQACFDVDLRDLCLLSQRLLGVEIGIELVCLARPPLHITPMFRALLTNEDENRHIQPYRLVFVVPKWINMSFWSSQDRYRQQWIPRCRIYDLQMVGLIENESKSLGLKSFEFEPNEMNGQFMRKFDAGVFKSVEMIDSQKRIELAAQTATSLELKPKQSNLSNRTTAMAITTKAFANPSTADMSQTAHKGNVVTTVSSSARSTLGALLQSGQGRSRSSSLTSGNGSNGNGNSNTSSSEPMAFQNDARIFTTRGEAPPISDKMFVPTPAHQERRKPARSPSVRFGVTTSHPLSRSPSSPDKRIARSPKSLVVPMCDTSRPELDNTSMWRVLPNPATIDNPSRVIAYGRWANVYPPNKQLNGVSWHSLKSPAALPITCESFTSLQNFKERYKFQFYDVAVDNDELSLPQLLNEMIGMRLQLGFQIAVGPNTRAVEASLPRGNPNKVVEIVPTEAKDCVGIRVYMTRVGLIHRLAIDDDRLINVRLYTSIERNTARLTCPINEGRHEQVKAKTRYGTEYEDVNNKFFDQGLERLNWSMLDQQVSGADDPWMYPSSTNTQNLATIRYVLVPTAQRVIPGYESLTPEEGYVEGITKTVRMLLRHRETGSIDSDFIVNFYTGGTKEAMKEILLAPNNALEMNRLNRSISLSDLAAEMQGPMGLQFRDRRWHWKNYRHVFTGHDFVVWLVRTFEDINTPEEAENFGVLLMRQGLFCHPEDRHPFIQGHYFYALMPQYQKQPSASDTSSLNDDSASDSNSPVNAPDQNSESAQHDKRTVIHISESFVINVDPRNVSGRPERVKVSIDRLHNPKNAFHIIVEWLNVTPRLVDNLFTSIGRMASHYGLRLVQVPIVDVAGSLENSPFKSSMKLTVNVHAESDDELRRFRHFLLFRCGYRLDIHDREEFSTDEYEVRFFWGKLKSSAPQYIHHTGYVLVQMTEDGSILVTANTLHVSRSVLSGHAPSSADSESELLMNQLRSLCADRAQLKQLLVQARQFWQQATERRNSSRKLPTFEKVISTEP